jgi:hypothetical protein
MAMACSKFKCILLNAINFPAFLNETHRDSQRKVFPFSHSKYPLAIFSHDLGTRVLMDSFVSPKLDCIEESMGYSSLVPKSGSFNNIAVLLIGFENLFSLSSTLEHMAQSQLPRSRPRSVNVDLYFVSYDSMRDASGLKEIFLNEFVWVHGMKKVIRWETSDGQRWGLRFSAYYDNVIVLFDHAYEELAISKYWFFWNDVFLNQSFHRPRLFGLSLMKGFLPQDAQALQVYDLQLASRAMSVFSSQFDAFLDWKQEQDALSLDVRLGCLMSLTWNNEISHAARNRFLLWISLYLIENAMTVTYLHPSSNRSLAYSEPWDLDVDLDRVLANSLMKDEFQLYQNLDSVIIFDVFEQDPVYSHEQLVSLSKLANVSHCRNFHDRSRKFKRPQYSS